MELEHAMGIGQFLTKIPVFLLAILFYLNCETGNISYLLSTEANFYASRGWRTAEMKNSSYPCGLC
ncbi:hypothetical protein OUZ56_025033 [Daphnia magna]|uniref:Uncharacterized protein n=1 Tax=Daphnia magna TaxID=35525 RepID=A0ABQ9ZIM8_9CRUS|nr:hypothetical protein OUZ56_025022 [Daphnia magna]KAK4012777.1 hypothetical protein OUZ56_025033 [Daphnia magna]